MLYTLYIFDRLYIKWCVMINDTIAKYAYYIYSSICSASINLQRVVIALTTMKPFNTWVTKVSDCQEINHNLWMETMALYSRMHWLPIHWPCSCCTSDRTKPAVVVSFCHPCIMCDNSGLGQRSPPPRQCHTLPPTIDRAMLAQWTIKDHSQRTTLSVAQWQRMCLGWVSDESSLPNHLLCWTSISLRLMWNLFQPKPQFAWK